MRIILVRHGLTEANLTRMFSHDDTKLHENGFDVLKNTKKVLEKFEIDRVYTSNLYRAGQTAELLGYDNYIKDEHINEMDVGDFKGRFYDDIKTEEADFFNSINQDVKALRFPGGESLDDVIERTSDFLDELVKKGENALCISHGLAIKASLFWILKDVSNWDNFWIENGSITVFKIEDGKKIIERVNLL